MRLRKGQIQHVFSFILITIVIFATIFLSITLFATVSEKTCEAEQKTLARTLSEIAKTYDTFGTKQDVRLLAPCGAEQLCLFSSQTTPETLTFPTTITPGIQQQLKTAAELQEPKPNVFLFREGQLLQEFFEPKLSPQNEEGRDDALCIRSSAGSFVIHTEGYGRTISVSTP